MKIIESNELKQIQLDMLLVFDKFCREHKLRYSLGGGTLLGAVRHKGYIPWDDDVDVMMPRPDYDRFVEKFNGYNENMYCSACGKDADCYVPFAKIYRRNTKLVNRKLKNRIGIFIDVFPIDGCPADYKVRQRHLFKLAFWTRLQWEKVSNCRCQSFYGYCYKIIAAILPQLIIQKQILRYLTKYSYDTSGVLGAISGVYGEKECYDRSVFDTYIYMPFENYQFMCIKDYDTYLSKHYGNYMELPPKEKQIATHAEKVYWIE